MKSRGFGVRLGLILRDAAVAQALRIAKCIEGVDHIHPPQNGAPATDRETKFDDALAENK